MKNLMLALLSVLGLENGFALTPSRVYQWSFPSPNLIANWSFENSLDSWREMPGGLSVSAHLKADLTKTGSFVAAVYGNSSGAGMFLASDKFRVTPSTTYTLSFYYKTYNVTTTNVMRPSLTWYSNPASGNVSGAYLATAPSWTLYTMAYTTPPNAEYLSVILAECVAGFSGTVYFDDVVLEEGALTSAQVLANRQNITQSIAYGDGLGRLLETQTLIEPGGTRYLMDGNAFDDFARPETAFAATPKTLPIPAFQTNLLGDAQAYYNNDATAFNANGYPFSRVKYVADAPSRVIESSSPGSAWQFGNGHTVKQDYYFVSDSLIPANIENPPTNNANCPYRLSWSKNQDSTYTLTWTDNSGFVIRKATNITRSASPANTWKWTATRYEYYPNGTLKKVYTPIDDSAGASNFAEVSQSDSRGRIISSTSPDRGLRKFWYSRTGQLRFSQDEEQRAAGEFTYMDYDVIGRLVSTGIQTNVGVSPSESCVDQDACGTGSKFEQIGYIYDDTTSFQARTGFTLLDILGSAKANVDVPKLSHRLFCKYNKNADNILSGFSVKDRFVADFYSYDERGNLKTTWKFTGPVQDASKRVQDCAYTYDSRDRLTGFTNHVSATEPGISASESYSYDFLGRVSAIKGLDDRFLARYSYAEWGPLSRVALGGLPSGDSSTYIEYGYHSQGGIKKIQATSHSGAGTTHFYEQYLGYEGLAFTGSPAPGPIQSKYDGSIAQQLNKYSSADAPNPVRLTNYAYDQMGRMLKAKAYLNTNGSILDGNEDIKASQLQMYATEELSTSMDYDLNGRILGQRSGGVSAADSARYSYMPNSYKLDKVIGKLTPDGQRDLSNSGMFTYDLNGALLRDKSKRMSMTYGWDGLPVAFTVDSVLNAGTLRCCYYDLDFQPYFFRLKYPSLTLNNFYDAEGNRVSRVETEAKADGAGPIRYRASHFAYLGGQMLKEWDETYSQAGGIKKTSTLISLLGQSAPLGRIRPDGRYEYFVKDHLGSTVRTVDDRGRYNNGSEKAYDYLAYGTSKLLKTGSDTTDVRQKFTGKEYEALTGLYAFGARWHDPELGMWMGPDPAGEYFNPYSYVGGNVVNLIDPFGLYSLSDFGDDLLSVGGTVGINVLGIGGCVLSSGQACAVGYYDHSSGDVGVLFGGIGPVPFVGEAHGNLNTNEFQTRGGIGGFAGGLPLGSTWNFGRTREDGPFFDVNVTITVDFADPHSSGGSGNNENGAEILVRDKEELQKNDDPVEGPTSPSGKRAMTALESALYSDFVSLDKRNKLGGESWAAYDVTTLWKFEGGGLRKFEALKRTNSGYAPLDADGGYSNIKARRSDDYVIHSHPFHPYPTFPIDYVHSERFPGESLIMYRPTSIMYEFGGGENKPYYTELY